MSETQYWDGWIEDDSKAPHEAITKAIESAEVMLKTLKKLRPKSLRKVAQEINAQVGVALRSILEDADLFEQAEPGMLTLILDDDIVKRFDIMEIARAIADCRDDTGDIDSDAAKDAWAQKFEAAAALIRGGKEKA